MDAWRSGSLEQGSRTRCRAYFPLVHEETAALKKARIELAEFERRCAILDVNRHVTALRNFGTFEDISVSGGKGVNVHLLVGGISRVRGILRGVLSTFGEDAAEIMSTNEAYEESARTLVIAKASSPTAAQAMVEVLRGGATWPRLQEQPALAGFGIKSSTGSAENARGIFLAGWRSKRQWDTKDAADGSKTVARSNRSSYPQPVSPRVEPPAYLESVHFEPTAAYREGVELVIAQAVAGGAFREGHPSDVNPLLRGTAKQFRVKGIMAEQFTAALRAKA